MKTLTRERARTFGSTSQYRSALNFFSGQTLKKRLFSKKTSENGSHRSLGGHSDNNSQCNTSVTTDSPRIDGSFWSLYQHHSLEGAMCLNESVRVQHSCTMMVLGCARTGKTMVIARLMKFLARQHKLNNTNLAVEIDQLDHVVTLTAGNGVRYLIKFVEVNLNKNDLWPSMDVDCYILTLSVDDWPTFRAAEKCLQDIRARHDSMRLNVVATRTDAVKHRVEETDIARLGTKYHADVYKFAAGKAAANSSVEFSQTAILMDLACKLHHQFVVRYQANNIDNSRKPARKRSRSCDDFTSCE